jgi:hypothetical protein
MRALSFLFALMVGLAMAFLAPALAGGHDQAPAAIIATEMAAAVPTDSMATDHLASDLLATDLLSSDLFTELSIDQASDLDVAA